MRRKFERQVGFQAWTGLDSLGGLGVERDAKKGICMVPLVCLFCCSSFVFCRRYIME